MWPLFARLLNIIGVVQQDAAIRQEAPGSPPQPPAPQLESMVISIFHHHKHTPLITSLLLYSITMLERRLHSVTFISSPQRVALAFSWEK